MTGKDLKAWAATLPDDAEIEQQKDPGYSFMTWIPFDATMIRAYRVFISTPPTAKAAMYEAEQEEPTL